MDSSTAAKAKVAQLEFIQVSACFVLGLSLQSNSKPDHGGDKRGCLALHIGFLKGTEHPMIIPMQASEDPELERADSWDKARSFLRCLELFFH